VFAPSPSIKREKSLLQHNHQEGKKMIKKVMVKSPGSQRGSQKGSRKKEEERGRKFREL